MNQSVTYLGLIVLLIFIVRARATYISQKRPWPFYPKKVLSQPEQVLYHRLVSALPDHIVLAQVQLSRVLGVKKGYRFNEWNNRINRMSLDFVVCTKDSAIVALVELDDKTHQQPSRVKADTKKNKAISDAGLRLIRLNVADMPNDVAIRNLFSEDSAG